MQAVLIAAVLGVTSCSASVGRGGVDGPGGTSVTAGATTTVDAGTHEWRDEDLAALLPTAAQVGAGFEVVEGAADGDDDGGGGSDGATDAALDEACPAAARLGDEVDGSDEGRPVATRSFAADDGREVEVELVAVRDRPVAEARGTLADIVDAVNACDTVRFETDGYELTGELEMRVDDAYGDAGLVLEMTWFADNDDLPRPVEIRSTVRLFVADGVQVTVTGIGDMDDDTFEPIPVAAAIIDGLSDHLDASVRAAAEE